MSARKTSRGPGRSIRPLCCIAPWGRYPQQLSLTPRLVLFLGDEGEQSSAYIPTVDLRAVKTCGTLFLLASSRPPSGQDAFRDRLAAQTKLAKFEVFEPMAQSLDEGDKSEAVSADVTVRQMRLLMANRYRSLLGCDYTERHEARARLRAIIDHGET